MTTLDSDLSIESNGLIIDVTHDSILVRLMPEVIEKLKETVSGDSILENALTVLLKGAEYPTIPISDINDISIEAIPSRPGSQEHRKVAISRQFHGGSVIDELPLTPEAADALVKEIKKRTNTRF
ncbi:MAG: hypothetical protein ACE1ZC_04290 [Nitrososphaerales archaeon]